MDVLTQMLQRFKKWPGLLIIIGLISSAILLASSMPKSGNTEAIRRVVIDAGHGGKDPGNLGTGRYKVTEKTIALNVALQLGEYIQKAYPDVEVLYTRSDDTFIPLHERTKFANTKGADLFISIHCDAFNKSSAIGCGSYVMGAAKTDANLRMAQNENKAILLEDNRDEHYGDFDPNSPEGLIELSLRQNTHIHQSLKFAKNVQDQMRTRVGRIDRGVKQAPFWVISFTTMPSVLIELGFLTNHEEEVFLQSGEGQDYLASAIYRAFKEYKTSLESIESTVGSIENGSEEIDVTTENETTTIVEETPQGITFRIQLASSSTKVKLVPANFNGLENVTEYEDNSLYKYLYGNATTYQSAKNLQKEARTKGYKGAFVVAFDENNNRIALDKAIELAGEN